MAQIALGVMLFTTIVLVLLLVVLAARARLVASGTAEVTVNDTRVLRVPIGDRLLGALGDNGLLLPSACGGKGTCAQCRVKVFQGGGALLPTEAIHISRRDASVGTRLSCQVAVKGDMSIGVPEEVFGVREWRCRVRSNRSVATYIKELVLELPEGETMEFRAGAYIQIECPAHHVRFTDMDIHPRFRPEWDRSGLWALESAVNAPVVRAYSMANHPQESGIIMLNVRIATPPPSQHTPPGRMSSWLFTRAPGDTMKVFGPFGDFFATGSADEMIFIGGGAGMAPMRSHVLDQLLRIRTTRRLSFWYGARNGREAFYVDEFSALQRAHDNFHWHLAFSEPLPEDEGHGYAGFIHEVVQHHYLETHPAPEDCEFYICGPPMMNAAVIHMLHDLGVDDDRIWLDDFGV
ncbi:MAG: NADH:ubiquinone reductase (Na(+)-transporting) subunit F [Chromatiales bacterium]|jgi:Na+-transporting NADH:ubiquinone oxidoreductase subunit F|nr:NADH:ubiquinone reductase (Na(+)-transporting) subunit F [Chromatiales bacterium]